MNSNRRLWVLRVCEGLAVLLLPFFIFIRFLLIHALAPLIKMRPVSVWTGAPIICMARNCKAERTLGFASYTVVKDTYFITDEFDFNISKIVFGNRFLILFFTYIAFLLICAFARQVHGYVDGGILPSLNRRQFNRLELYLYRLLNIKLFIWTYGADVRTQGITIKLGQPNCCTDCTQVKVACICDAGEAKRNYQEVTKSATAIFSMGDMIEYTPNSRNDLFFWPIDLQANQGLKYEPSYPSLVQGRPLRVVHAPNHREFKGSKYLEIAINSLKEKGVEIELVLVERLPNTKAIELYKSADLIFDQCLIGYHGYFALEAMALGKPVMCFIRWPERYLLNANECPLININLETLQSQLQYYATEGRRELPDIGKRSRIYIEQYFSMEAFAQRLAVAYTDIGVEY